MEKTPVNLFLDVHGVLSAKTQPKEMLEALLRNLEEAGFAPTVYVFSFGKPLEETWQYLESNDIKELVADVFRDVSPETVERLRKIPNINAPFALVDDNKESASHKITAILLAQGNFNENIDPWFIHYDSRKSSLEICAPEIKEKIDAQRGIKEDLRVGLAQTFPPEGLKTMPVEILRPEKSLTP